MSTEPNPASDTAREAVEPKQCLGCGGDCPEEEGHDAPRFYCVKCGREWHVETHGLKTYGLSNYPGEYMVTESHPSNAGADWYSRKEVDKAIEKFDTSTTALRREVADKHALAESYSDRLKESRREVEELRAANDFLKREIGGLQSRALNYITEGNIARSERDSALQQVAEVTRERDDWKRQYEMRVEDEGHMANIMEEMGVHLGWHNTGEKAMIELQGIIGKRVIDLQHERDAALARAEAGEKDTARLDWLEKRLSHPNYWDDLVLAWDHEDGVWLSKIKRGDYMGARPLEITPHQPTVRAAIDAATGGTK